METYREMNRRHEAEWGALPIWYAFNDGQFAEGARKHGAAENGDGCVSLGYGAYCKREDKPRIMDTYHRHEKELSDALQVEAFAVPAFEYEFGNHEYSINWDGEGDMARCFGLPWENVDGFGRILWDKVPNGEKVRGYYAQGYKLYREAARKNGWE